MDTNYSNFNQTIEILIKNILSEGITLFNHNDIIQALQIIIKNENNEIKNKHTSLLMLAIEKYEDNFPLITLLTQQIKNNILLNFLFDNKNNNCCDDNNIYDSKNKQPEVYREANILENGDKEIITFQLDPKTQEKIILDKELIKKPNENEIENIFSGFLNPKNNTETEMTENDL